VARMGNSLRMRPGSKPLLEREVLPGANDETRLKLDL